MRVLLLVVSSGCARDPAPTGSRGSGSLSPAPTEPATAATTASDDLALVEALVAGEGDPAQVVRQVAWSGGWPVVDGTSAWFVLVDGGGPWSVAGDFDAWSPEPMTAGEGFWWARVEVGDPTGLRYKFTTGTDWIADPAARSYTYDGYGEISFVRPPLDTYRLDRWPGVEAEGLRPRDLRVYVPAGDGPWPVLYAHDGQNLFDPHAIWGGWRLQDALATRDPMLVVGIDNTEDRFDEYTHVADDIGLGAPVGGDGDAYAALVDGTIRPHVEATYGSTGLDGTFGSSLGGLVSLVIAQDHPGDYDFAASLSGTLGWGRFALENETVEERWLAAPPAGTVVYVDSGGGPGDDGGCFDLDGDGFSEDDPDSSDNYCETRQFADDLAAHGWTWDDDLFHWWEPGATHDEVAWSLRVGQPIDTFLSLR